MAPLTLKGKHKKTLPSKPPEQTLEEQFPFQWYCVTCTSAAECRVALHIRNYVEKLNWEHLFDTYLIPWEAVLAVRAGGEKVVKKERLFTGYLLIRVRLTPDFRDLITSISGVVAIIGDRSGVTPQPIPDRQISQIIAMMVEAEGGEVGVRRKPKFVEGSKVVIRCGDFENFTGIVQDHVGARVQVGVNIFGRFTKAVFHEDVVVLEEKFLKASGG